MSAGLLDGRISGRCSEQRSMLGERCDLIEERIVAADGVARLMLGRHGVPAVPGRAELIDPGSRFPLSTGLQHHQGENVGAGSQM
jgi:hypothetical protein